MDNKLPADPQNYPVPILGKLGRSAIEQAITEAGISLPLLEWPNCVLTIQGVFSEKGQEPLKR